jgi:hypothetical protein
MRTIGYSLLAALFAFAPACAAWADPTYTLAQARSMVTSALLAEGKCPGVKLSAPKTRAMIAASNLSAEAVMDKDAGQDTARRMLMNAALMASLCAAARDPRVPFHFLVDVTD